MIVPQFSLRDSLTPAGHWVLPAIELLLLLVLVAANPRRIERRSPALRGLGLVLIGTAGLANGWSVALLVDGLVRGTTGNQPAPWDAIPGGSP